MKDPIAVELGRRGGVASAKKTPKEKKIAQAKHMNEIKRLRKSQEAESSQI